LVAWREEEEEAVVGESEQQIKSQREIMGF
jgi:hypothetical protein